MSKKPQKSNRSTSDKLWHALSYALIVMGLSVILLGGWLFYQQQVDALSEPPVRVVETTQEELAASEQVSRPAEEPRTKPAELAATPSAAVRDSTTARDTVPSEGVAAITEEGPSLFEMVGQGLQLFEFELNNRAARDISPPPETFPSPQPTATIGPIVTAPAERTISQVGSLSGNPLETTDPININDALRENVPAMPPLTRITVPSIALDSPIVEVGWQEIVQNGVTTNIWTVADYAAGWHKNSMLPTQGGNIVLSGHHNIKGEVFRDLIDLELNQTITVYTSENQPHEYVIVDKFIVKDKGEPLAVRRANAKWIGPFNEERLTLVTCWPYNSNTHRLIVIAKPINEG